MNKIVINAVISALISANCKIQRPEDFFGGSLQGNRVIAQKFENENR